MKGQKHYTRESLVRGGGIDLFNFRELVDSPRAAFAVNLLPYGDELRTRPGWDGLAQPDQTTDTVESFGVYTGSSVYAVCWMDDLGVRSVKLTPPTIGSTASIKGATANTDSTGWDWVQAVATGGQGPFFAMNGADAPTYWSGSGNMAAFTASAGTLPNGRYLEYHGNRLWVAGVTASPTTLYWSSLSATGGPDLRNWATTAPDDSSSAIIGDDGFPITALCKLGPHLLVFKATSIYLIYNLNDGSNRRVSNIYGATAAVETPHGACFVGKDGLMITDGNSIKTLYPMPREEANGKALAYHDGRLWLYNIFTEPSPFFSSHLFGASDGENNALADFVYDFDTGTLWPQSLLWDHPTQFTENWRQMAVANDDLYAISEYSTGPPISTYLYKMESQPTASTYSQDYDGTNVQWRYATAAHSFGEPHLNKRLHEIRLDADGTVSLSTRRYPSDSNVAQTAVDWEAQSTVPTQRRFYTPGSGRLWQMLLSGSGLGVLRGYTASFTPRRD